MSYVHCKGRIFAKLTFLSRFANFKTLAVVIDVFLLKDREDIGKVCKWPIALMTDVSFICNFVPDIGYFCSTGQKAR